MTKEDLQPLANIDKIIHEPARLMILSHLYVVERADFLFLKQQTGLTSGNLSSHLNKLENAEYVAVTKEFLDKKPHTMLSLTAAGRKAFKEYMRKMKQVFDDLSE
ncbi:MAG: transcriptional regulator [Euryarchaeota archaeon]|nr:transcriptional regulator [Euryarchaeota archaeon]